MRQPEIRNEDSTSLKIILEASGNVSLDYIYIYIYIYIYWMSTPNL